jgi:methylmalonyl-CoA mutase N-terminal domain/subunit
VKIALRTQQILAYETGIPETADPLAGSYAIEARTLDIERDARALIEKIDTLGGATAAIESGFMQHEIGESAYRAQRALEDKTAIVVGVNEFLDDGKNTLPTMTIDESVERDQVARLQAFRASRTGDWRRALTTLDEAARSSENLMPHIVEAVRNDCTIGEIVNTLKQTFGEHTEQGF